MTAFYNRLTSCKLFQQSTCISPKEVLPTNQFFFTEHFSSMTDSDRTWPS
ncbi:hypothetical protein Peur_053309 [Populus x canadensis]